MNIFNDIRWSKPLLQHSAKIRTEYSNNFTNFKNIKNKLNILLKNKFYSYFILIILNINIINCQILNNKPPYFEPGSGDMARFSLSENTPVGSPVYQLKGFDPEGSSIHYSISGPVFSVDRNTGVIRLRQELDREKQNLIEVIISLTDEGINGSEPNTISLRREIPIRDYNDNAPTFVGRPYSAKVLESTFLGTNIDIRPPILVIDKDEGINSEIELSCHEEGEPNICATFHVNADKISNGNYTASISLLKQLDFESRASYIMTLMAKDKGRENQLTSFATIAISVLDVQDQPPIFLDAPYSATVPENTAEGTKILAISAIDGDIGNPRPLFLSLENEYMGNFKLEPIGNDGDGKSALVTSNVPIDRESLEILEKGGVYTFNIRATEIVNNELGNDFTITQVTIVVTDVDDHYPEFNNPLFNISITENLGNHMPLPGLSLYANDRDLGKNSHYFLSIRNVQNADNVFEVAPTESEGRTPVVIKVTDSNRLDYDVDDPSLREFIFDVIASVDGIERAISRITVNLVDMNDNTPIFAKPSYEFDIEENLPYGTKIGDIVATDLDSGNYGTISYLLKGFGAENFYVDQNTGTLYIQKSLDYEKQTSFSLSVVARDGGGRETNTNLHLRVIDLNDNHPIFESPEYTRTVREGAIEFEPQFFVRATDIDGVNQGGGKIAYSIQSENSISGQVFTIDENTGELKFRRVAKSMDTERGQYDLIIEATDFGIPPLQNTTRVMIRVGISGNQRPIFKGQFHNFDKLPISGPPSYRVSLSENAKPADNVTTVVAQDPDGIDSLLRYSIVGANDNFVINEFSGLIQVSPQAYLDRDANPNDFQIIVNAIDAGFPIPETATTTVYVQIKDINNKPPKFEHSSYVAYVSERTDIGVEVLKVKATDTDLNSNLEYKIQMPVRATTKTGVISGSYYNAEKAFRIDNTTGQIFINGFLKHDVAAVIFLKIEVKDLNAELNIEEQVDMTEVTIYIQSFQDTNPIFRNKGWRNTNPVISVTIKEEMPLESTLFSLQADDPVTNLPINNFELITRDDFGYFELHNRTGEIILKKRLDYESLNQNAFDFQVKAKTIDENRFTISTVNITVENVNDNAPVFDKEAYYATLIENKKFPEKVITVRATDKDAVLNEFDNKIGYNKVMYSLQGEHAKLFQINNLTGEIIIAEGQNLDREKQSKINLTIKAEDTLGRSMETKYSLVDLIIDLLDVNDNSPKFLQKNYTAVIPENVPLDAFVLNITATDPDEGPGGEIFYDIVNEGEVYGLFKINRKTGEMRTKKMLTGKGRAESYEIQVRAQDNGAQVPKQHSLYNDVTVVIYIGDVSANDGIPYFIAPQIGQIANISENATIGSAVFQVMAIDPDNPNTPSGSLFYKIQEDTMDSDMFHIDSISGLITTMSILDRELRDSYNVILEVSDNGMPRQSATRILRINVLDIDDHQPRFERDVDAPPIELEIFEEQSAGTVVGNISAIDKDIDENGAINYMFIEGNEENIFNIQRTDDNMAIITTNKKLDREIIQSYLVTIKCFKLGVNPTEISRKEYNRYDESEIQVRIKIIDIDDNLPQFERKDLSVGVRINVPVDTVIAKITATDKDPDAIPIAYSISNITYVPQFYKRRNKSDIQFNNLFILNNKTGELRTGGIFYEFVDGYFHLKVKANNSHKSRRHSYANIKIFVIRDKSLLRFIFAKSPTDIQNVMHHFQNKIQNLLKPMNLEINVYDTQVLTKDNLSLDFSGSSSCFQLFRNGTALPLNQMKKIMDSELMKNELIDIYVEFGISNIDTCSVKRKLITSNLMLSSGAWLVILSALIGIAAVIVTCTAFCITKKFKKQTKRSISNRSRTPPEPFGSIAGTGPIYYSEPIYGPL